MDLYSNEKILSTFLGASIALSAICCITSAVAWTHWKYVLDACPETNCGCFLYGLTTRTSYQGGHIAYCHYATYGLIIPIIFAIIFCCFHGYRVCMGVGKRKSGRTTVRQRDGEIIVVTAQSELSDNDLPSQYWVVISIISCLMALYTLIYASIYTDGFNNSCREYRNELLKYVDVRGSGVEVIKHRLTCGSIFDFMDYLHADGAGYRIRNGRINTSLCLYFAIISAWFTVFSWIIVSSISIISARRSKQTEV